MTDGDHPDSAAPPPPAKKASIWWTVLGGVLSVGLVAAILAQLGGATAEVVDVLARLPPLVWPFLVLLYLVQPAADYLVFRRLWNMPLAGFEALLRKNVINEVFLGYSGEAYLYVWAKRAADAPVAPFASIKDANIVSALLGNLMTVILAAACVTELRDLDLARQLGPALWSGLIPVALSVVLLIFGRRVFSLPRKDLAIVALIHGARLILATSLLMLVWRTASPEVAPALWFVLLAVRYLISRIPFISNKDLVFGNLMLLLLGPKSSIAVLLAALALATLMMHLTVIVGLGIVDLARGLRRGPAPPAAELGRGLD
ncbi:hypothetical protein [uncultured Caulobacter sp.]|uniref:hypothetical protein n=1 Tax=uncultured Caulobacter sp. TaxID=158749 RepID=UPI00262A416A|nr:hypothetical protein [uncultured Caulobacter sp.]